MPRFKRWFNRTHSGPKPGSPSLHDPGSIAAEEQATTPNAVHESNWDSLKRDGQFNLTPECKMDIMGASGVGKKTLLKSLLYGDMSGGAKLAMSMLMMDDEVPRYYCHGFIYSLRIIFATDHEASIPGMLSRYDQFGLILAYDVSSHASLDFLSRIYESIAHRGNSLTIVVPTAILGLKSDLWDENGISNGDRVSREEGERTAKNLGCHFSECSAMTGYAVYDSFGYFVKEARVRELKLPNAAVNPASGMQEAFNHALAAGLSLERE